MTHSRFGRSTMLEKEIEMKLVRAVRRKGGLCPKWVSPGLNGVPDRIILLPGRRVAFAELKAPGRRPRPIQVLRHEQLRTLGFPVYVIDNPGQIENMLEEVGAGTCPDGGTDPLGGMPDEV